MSTVIYQPYVYIIKFKPTQQIYIGVQFRETNDIANPCQLWTTYFGSGPNVIKLREMFDDSDFQCRVLSVWNTKEEVLAEESRILKKYDAKNNLRFLNESNGGGGGVRHHTEEVRKVMSEKAVQREAKKKADGYVVPQSTRDKVSKRMIGNQYRKDIPHSEEDRKAISRGLKDKPKSKKHRESLSKANKGNPNCSGKRCSRVIESRKNNPLYHHPYVDTMLELHEQGLYNTAIFRQMNEQFPELNIHCVSSVSCAIKSIKRLGL